jgi:hypothetical protein
LVALVEVRGGRRDVATTSTEAAAEENDDGEVPVED